MRKQLISLFLIGVILTANVGTAYALTIWDWYNVLTGGTPINPFGWVFYLYNATQWLINYVGDLQEIANWSYPTTKASLAAVGSSYITYLYNVEDGSEWLKHYALARAKAIYVQELANGSTPAQAMQKAIDTVNRMYENKIKELIEHQNVTVLFLEKTLPHYKKVCDLYKYNYNISVYPTMIYATDYMGNEYKCDQIWWWETKNVTQEYNDYYYKVLYITYAAPYTSDNNGHVTSWVKGTQEPSWVKVNGDVIYDKTLFKQTLNKLINDKKWVYGNLVNYFTRVNQLIQSGQLNVSEVANKVLDPYAIITMAKNDSANYYAWLAYQLALLGLLTNYTAPVTLDINGTKYSGYLFASDGFNTTLTVNGTYTIPDGESVYLLTPNGKILVLQGGEQFKLIDAKDEKTGKPLQNITLVRYVDHSLEAQKLLEDVEKLIELYNLTLQKTTTTGGGSSGNSWADSINDFIANLSWETKLFIGVCMGAVVLAVIGRSFGRGGVSVIRMGK